MPDEIELKLRIAPQDAAKLRRHPAILQHLVGKPVTRKLTSIYYDTPDLRLLDAGVSLRVRHMAGGWFQAVKAKGKAVAGLHQRLEWEDIIAADHPDFSKIIDPALTRIFDDDDLRQALSPIFITDVQRSEWQLHMPDGSHVELALDLGELRIGSRREAIEEIELELKHGNARHLFEVALALQADIPLHIENISKAERGYAYYRPIQPPVVKAKPVSLDKNMHADAAWRAIGWECLTQLQANQDMVLHGNDPEGIHQMRVALRRLRSAIGIFRDILDDATSQSIREELRWLANELGTARDLDVFIHETLPPLFEHLDDATDCLHAIRNKALTANDKAYRNARVAISSQRYQKLLLSLGHWLETSAIEHAPRITELANALLRKRHKQLRRHGRLLREAHPEERHLTRIAGKKLRYTAEFLACLYSPEQTSLYLRGLAELLDILGTLNDIAVTRQLLQQLAGPRPNTSLTKALQLFEGWNGCHAMHKLTHMDTVWKHFAEHRQFWD